MVSLLWTLMHLMWSASYALLCIRFVMQRLTHAMLCILMRTPTYVSMPLCCLMQCAISYAILCYVYEPLSFCVLMCSIMFYAILCSWVLMRYSFYTCHASVMHCYASQWLCVVMYSTGMVLCKFMQLCSYAGTSLCILCNIYALIMRPLGYASLCQHLAIAKTCIFMAMLCRRVVMHYYAKMHNY